MSKTPKRPRDPNQLAKSIVDIATGEAENQKPTKKDPAAVALGRKGGEARAKNLTPEERKVFCRESRKKSLESGLEPYAAVFGIIKL